MPTETVKHQFPNKSEQSILGGEKFNHRLVGRGLRDTSLGHSEIGISRNNHLGPLPIEQPQETKERHGAGHHHAASPVLLVHRSQKLGERSKCTKFKKIPKAAPWLQTNSNGAVK